MSVPETRKPWNRLPDETDTAYHRFRTYLELGPDRSLSKVGQKLGKSRAYKTHLEKWSSKYDWVYRAGKYDDHIAIKALENREKLLDKAHARMLNLLDSALDQYEEILLLDNVIYVGEGSTTTMNDRIKVVKDLLDRLGVNFAVKEGMPEDGKAKVVNNYYQQIYNDLRGE